MISRSDILVGSPQFMAPERAQHGVSGPAADLWSLGATLYSAVEGKAPYERGSTMATLTALTTEEPDPPKRAGAVRPLLDGLLRKDPATRMNAEDAEALARAVLTGMSGSDETPADERPAPTGLAGLVAAFRIPRPRSSGDSKSAERAARSAAGAAGVTSSGGISPDTSGSDPPELGAHPPGSDSPRVQTPPMGAENHQKGSPPMRAPASPKSTTMDIPGCMRVFPKGPP